MKIEKIHLNKIKVTFTYEDLIEHNITPEAVKNNAPQMQKVLMNVVRKAEEETGFSASDCRLMVEAMPGENDSLVMYITKLDDMEDLREAVHAVKRRIKLKVRPTENAGKYACIKFSDFEDAVNMAKFFSEEEGGCLYFYQNSYYMVIENTDPLFSEFGIVSDCDSVADSVSEHGKLISENALYELRTYF
ncbi:MAG: adaptor protein MecA [Clostridia bacterium]